MAMQAPCGEEMEQNHNQYTQPQKNPYSKPAPQNAAAPYQSTTALPPVQHHPQSGSQVPPYAPYGAQGYAPHNAYGQQGAYAPYYAQPPKRKRISAGLIVFICIISAVVLIGFGVLVHSTITNLRGNQSSDSSEPTVPSADEFDSLDDNALKPGVDSGNNDLKLSVNKETGSKLSTTEIAQKSKNSVIGISVYSTDGILKGEGSGMVVGTNTAKTKSYIVTCAHVIEDENEKETVFKIVDSSGKEYLAAVVGYDAGQDVGVLSVEKTDFEAVEFGDSSKMQAGQTVVAIGNPGGSEFFGSVTQGVISATDRMLSISNQAIMCIQHDAAINPGSSGGALFNEYGQVIGINYSKIAMEDYEGMNFAIPSNTAVERANRIIAENLKTHGARIGMEYYVSASYFDENYKQLVIKSIDEKSDMKGKAEEGDFIIAANGKKITDKYTIVKIINEKSVGDTITLTIAHKNEKTGEYDTKDIEVKLIEKK